METRDAERYAVFVVGTFRRPRRYATEEEACEAAERLSDDLQAEVEVHDGDAIVAEFMYGNRV